MQDRHEIEAPPDRGDRGSAQFQGGPNRKPPPSAIVLLAGTIMLGLAAGWYLAPRAPAKPPVIDMVASADFNKAITTLSAEGLQQAGADPRECRVQMGYITVATPGNPAGGTVRFRTNRYQSPPFVVTDKPQRIAIPNPFPGTGGTGLLTVEGEAKGLVVALSPPTPMEPVNGSATTEVIFLPVPPCKP
jgi:hypothetical protein